MWLLGLPTAASYGVRYNIREWLQWRHSRTSMETAAASRHYPVEWVCERSRFNGRLTWVKELFIGLTRVCQFVALFQHDTARRGSVVCIRAIDLCRMYCSLHTISVWLSSSTSSSLIKCCSLWCAINRPFLSSLLWHSAYHSHILC